MRLSPQYDEVMAGAFTINKQEIVCACSVKMAITILPSRYISFDCMSFFFYLADTNVPNAILNQQATLC